MAQILTPPAPLDLSRGERSVFLAGSIEMGAAEHWQAEAERSLADMDLTVLNPRRHDWDSSWVQSTDNPQFRAQVQWELDALERATVIIFYFAADTRAPITLMELGLHARGGRALVCCPQGYWRKGNVDMVCQRYGVPRAGSLEELVVLARQALAGAV